MPQVWNNILVVTKEELVPEWYPSLNSLSVAIHRYKDKNYGIKRVQLGGNGRQLLIAFDSLPSHIQDGIGDPRKVDHILERFYKVDSDAVAFFRDFRFEDGTALDMEYQERYIINASMIKALFALKEARETERRTKGGSITGIMATLLSDANSFNKTLKVKHGVAHTLPQGERMFRDVLKFFANDGFASLISKRHKNNNARKVTDETLLLLNSMFSEKKTKPTATEVHRQYNAFLSGYVEVINNATGELYSPKGFKKLSPKTVTGYLSQWSNKIGTYAARSGDRQKLMQQFKPHHSLDRPQFAGSIISIDDRQPPFKIPGGKRIWFYNGIDLASEAFTCWVHGKDKEGLIVDFYRQMVRNYAMWGFNLPAELEAEMSLNSSFVNTFLKEGAMFQYVRIEANNARGKRIEAYYKPLRYQLEKKREGWLARPFALSESNQAGPDVVRELPYDTIRDGCLADIETWNNMPHSDYPEAVEDFRMYGFSDKPYKTRWKVFEERQNPNLLPTNYLSILPYIGYKTNTSCNVGIIRLQRSEFLLGDNGQISTGEQLIRLMKQVEGQEIEVYWLDGNDGNVLKALVFQGTQYICEAVAKPTYNRARIEQTPQDLENRELMSKYVATIEAYSKQQKAALEPITIIENTPVVKKDFVMPGLKKSHAYVHEQQAEILEQTPDEYEDFIEPTKQRSYVTSLSNRY